MTATSLVDNLFHGRLREGAGTLFWLGVAMTLLGVVALAFPMISTLAVTLFVGWMLLFSGAFTLAGSFSIHGTGPFFGALLFSLLSIGLGLYMVFNPAAGALALTLTVGALFMLGGAYELYFAFQLRPLGGWGVMLVSGLASIALAVLILVGWPQVSQIVLGVLIGVNFITTGLGYIFVSRAAKAALA